MGKTKNFTGENFWARGYFVSTVGLDEEVVKAYIREQEKEEEQYEQLSLWKLVIAFRRFMNMPL